MPLIRDEHDRPPAGFPWWRRGLWLVDLASARATGDPGPGDLNRYLARVNELRREGKTYREAAVEAEGLVTWRS